MHKSTDALGEVAMRLMMAGFRGGKTYTAIARDLAEIGVEVPERTIARRGLEWRAEEARRQAARDQVKAIVAAAKHSPDASEILRALATDALMTEAEAFQQADPVKVQRLNLKAEELRIKREDLKIRERAVASEETRVRLLEEKERRMTAALTEDKGEHLTAEERLKRAMEAWGLK